MVREKPDNVGFNSQSRRRAERLHAAPDIGNEPPLNPGGISAPRADRRAVSPRWFSGAVLTGVSGVALIGSAIYVSLESDASVLRTPEMVNASYRPTSGASGDAPVVSTHRADRLVRFEISPGARQNFKSPVTLKAGAMEVIKVRNFVRVASPLAMSTGQYATDIPPFNPLQMFTENGAGQDREAQPDLDVSDAEVSLVKTALTGTETYASPGLSEAEAAAQVRQLRQMDVPRPSASAPVLPLPPQLLLSRSLKQMASGESVEGEGFGQPADGSFSRIEVHVIPENLTVLAKATPDAAQASEEELVTLKKDETLEKALSLKGADDGQIRAIMRALSAKMRVGSITEGSRLRILVAPAPVSASAQTPGQRQIVRVMVIGSAKVDAIAALDDKGTFVAIEPENDTATASQDGGAEDGEERGSSNTPRLYASLYETGLKNGLSREMVADLIRIFAYDFDLERHITPSDRLEVFFAEDEESGGSPEMLFASLSVGGETRSVYRYQSPDGTVEYFDRDGKSLKKFLLRKPISEGMLRSGFGMRHHPILGYSKMHTGVDWANKVGTPILSAGDGIVTKAGWHSGYGRHTEVQHTNGYVTTYSHQSAFAKGVTPGVRVRQGQVIGYLGSSGLSTGPHLHYEVLINGRFVNPMRIKVPRGGALDGAMLADFRRNRQQVDALIEKADGPRVASAVSGAPTLQP